MRRRKNAVLWIAITVLILILLLLRTCGSGSTILRSSDFDVSHPTAILPPGSTFIFSFQLDSISDKVELSELNKKKSFREKLQATFQQNPPLTLVVGQPAEMAVDFSKKGIFYVNAGSKPSEVYSAVVIPVNSATTITQTLKSHVPLLKIRSEKNYSIAKIDHQTSCAWNDHFLISLTSDPTFDKDEEIDDIFNSNRRKYFDDQPEIKEYLFDNSDDVRFWLDMDNYAKNQIFPITQGRDLMDPKLLKGNIYKGIGNFNDGEITIDVDLQLNSLLSGIENRIFRTGFDNKLISSMPALDPGFELSACLDIKGLMNLAFVNVDNRIKVRDALTPYGLLIEDIYEIFTGDIIFATYANPTKKYSTLLGLKIKNMETFLNIVQIGLDLKYLQQELPGRYIMPKEVDKYLPLQIDYEDRRLRMQLAGGMIFISGDRAILDAITHKEGLINADVLLQESLQSDQKFKFNGNVIPAQLDKNQTSSLISDYRVSYINNRITAKILFHNTSSNALTQLLQLPE